MFSVVVADFIDIGSGDGRIAYCGKILGLNSISIEIDENLVDYLIPHWVHIAQDDPAAIVSQFTALTENTDVKLLPDIYPRTPPGEKYAEAAKLMYDAGADGFAFWSAEMRTTRASEWAVVKRLGHKDELNRYSKEAPKFWRSVNLKELDGVITRYSHNDG